MTTTQTPPPAVPAAGWYADPSGQGGQRYWNGEQWTDHRQAAAPINHWAPSALGEQGGTSGLVVVGYILAAVMPIVGFVLGIVVFTRPAKAVSKHGIWIIVVSVVAFILWIAILSSGSGGDYSY
jgi:uncharacterized membrane protein YhaH (DUF805 family)